MKLECDRKRRTMRRKGAGKGGEGEVKWVSGGSVVCMPSSSLLHSSLLASVE
jgi:hypothetical protein